MQPCPSVDHFTDQRVEAARPQQQILVKLWALVQSIDDESGPAATKEESRATTPRTQWNGVLVTARLARAGLCVRCKL